MKLIEEDLLPPNRSFHHWLGRNPTWRDVTRDVRDVVAKNIRIPYMSQVTENITYITQRALYDLTEEWK
jgi:hypothetical protein